MSSQFNQISYPFGVPSYPSVLNFPSSANNNDLVIAQDTDTLYAYDSESNSWITVLGHVTNGKLAPMPANTIKGNNTGSTDSPEDLTVTQATAMLNPVVGDSGSGGIKGLVPAPAAGDANANKFLNANGSWVAVSSISETDKFYVDGDQGNDTTANGTMTKPFKTIQACLNYLGQPITRADAMRHIGIFISDTASSISGFSPQTFTGCYEENLTVPTRWITMYGAGVKIGSAGVTTGVGNILKEYSSSRRFGATSSEFRATLTFDGVENTRDSHPRLRLGFHVGGTCRTSILRRTLDSIQGDGVNHITVHVAPGQFTYPITIPTTYPAEPYIRISITGTTNYNEKYDITSKINSTTFIATRVSGTNANTGIETSGAFFESDSAGASGLTHDAGFIDTYMQGAYTCDDGVVNSGAITAGGEVLYSINSRFFTGITGAGITCQRFEDTTIAGNNAVSSIAGMNNCSFSGTFSVNTFTYSTDDMGFMDCRFNSAVPFTVLSAGQTVRMDGVTLTSFLNTSSSWVTNTPTIAYLNDSKGIGYSAGTPSNWAGTAPTTSQQAIDRMSTLLKTLNGGVAIP